MTVFYLTFITLQPHKNIDLVKRGTPAVVKKKKQNVTTIEESSKARLRLVTKRNKDRREADEGNKEHLLDQRTITRRQEDSDKSRQELNILRQENERLQERQYKLIISKPELVLYYSALILSVNVIFGWMAYLALFL